jgi:hypothetical protein
VNPSFDWGFNADTREADYKPVPKLPAFKITVRDFKEARDLADVLSATYVQAYQDALADTHRVLKTLSDPHANAWYPRAS